MIQRLYHILLILSVCAGSALAARAQTCQTANDLDDATHSAIATAGKRYFDLAAKADTASLRQSAIPSLAADFSGVESVIKEHQQNLSAAPPAPKIFQFEVEGKAPLPHGEFLCGVFGANGQTATSAAFYLDNLAPAKYAVVIFDIPSPARTYFSLILQQIGSDWKLGGVYIKPAQFAGHDSDWFAARARDYKAKGQTHNAWLYAAEARSLLSPVPFMSTQATDKLDAEVQSLTPSDAPANGKTADLPSGTAPAATYKLIALFPAAVGNDLDLIVKYQAADISNTNQAYASNVAVMKALITKYPELRDAFAGVVARATDSSGRDYGTLLAMKDIK